MTTVREYLDEHRQAWLDQLDQLATRGSSESIRLQALTQLSKWAIGPPGRERPEEEEEELATDPIVAEIEAAGRRIEQVQDLADASENQTWPIRPASKRLVTTRDVQAYERVERMRARTLRVLLDPDAKRFGIGHYYELLRAAGSKSPSTRARETPEEDGD